MNDMNELAYMVYGLWLWKYILLYEKFVPTESTIRPLFQLDL